ncbi:hypothetical protein [Thalassomonas haliotis]|uniref:Uncharacterized protein n=1 Tax=Thalassomonas haliotis TaxID=485448 RepID=A0ABY7V947_9GAMM|nr:hypothetical protein [Thalassomonas haliotis]WDE09432.1 hypothetical protein H3N35_13900 [Thalassomonas haliotis]
MTPYKKRSKEIALLMLVLTGALFYYFVDVIYEMDIVTDDITRLKTLKNDKPSLIEIVTAESYYVLKIQIDGVNQDADDFSEKKAHYQNTAFEYVCNSSLFKTRFDEGKHIDVELFRDEQGKEPFAQVHVSKDKCRQANS